MSGSGTQEHHPRLTRRERAMSIGPACAGQRVDRRHEYIGDVIRMVWPGTPQRLEP